jgi:UTP:GlnB (protein PII) uridylyltransferase
VRVAFLDREAAIAELTLRARRLMKQDQCVIAIGLFGSLARRQALPSSDADLLIVLQEHSKTRWFDRIPEYAAAFEGTALPVEPFPYTIEELQRMSAQSGFVRTALQEAISLGGRQDVLAAIRKNIQ